MKNFVTLCTVAVIVFAAASPARADVINVTTFDMTPTVPLSNPIPSSYQPRYISGFGSGDSFTVFFEDRDNDYAISYISTTSGPTGFPASATATNIRDTHLCVKDWPINIGGTDYKYRAWGAMWDTPEHNFYVSNDLDIWTWVNTFEIPNFENFHSGYVYYGFHDVIQINGTYYAWGECNIGYTLMCRSTQGDDKWEAFARVGGLYSLPDSGPLQLPGEYGPTPTGAFFELGNDRGYGKLMMPCDDSAIYLAVNTAAKPSLPAADLEAAFINPANWTWHDGNTGLPATAILTATSERDLRECWLLPNGSADWIILYDGDYGADGGKALGYATLSTPFPCTPVSLISLTEGPLLVPVGMPVSFQAIISDGCGQVDALWDFGDDTYDSQAGVANPVTAAHTYDSTGIYLVVLGLSDYSGFLVDGGSLSVIVYDPAGGFATGGGWIDSPVNENYQYMAVGGKAHFGFVSKYKKGADKPTGNTEFVFQAGNLNFYSSSYDWLLVTGSNYARFKGWGSVNNQGDYRFMLWAGDNEPDTFRIKIWWEDGETENVVYDNGMDQPIEGGSIIIHRK